MDKITDIMQQAAEDRVFPGAVLLLSKDSDIIFFEAFGYADIYNKTLVKQDTVFDLASLTKPLATTLAVIKLIQGHKLELEQEISSILSHFKGTDKKQISLKNLLSHNSGLPDYKPYYKILETMPIHRRKYALRTLLVKEPLLYRIGEKVLYSDLGFMIIGWIVEYVTGKKLSHFVCDEIYKHLGIDKLFFIDTCLKASSMEFASTEFCLWRRDVINGVVHDENAYVVGGVEGHAGLFGTAESIHVLLSNLLSSYNGCNKTSIFQRDILHKFFSIQKNTDRVLGFDSPSLCGSSSGKYFSKNSVGHLGFTGTSFWMDLDKNIIVILLTNRVHPTRFNKKIKAFRPYLHNSIMENFL